jgi:hypothetical protein
MIVNSRERGTPPARSGGVFNVAAVLTAAALLMTASAAFGAADPLKGGTTTIGPLKLPKKVNVSTRGGATKRGKTVTLPITGGSLDPTNGSGPVQNGGSIVLKRGKHKAKLTGIVTTFGSGGKIAIQAIGSKYKEHKGQKIAKILGGTVGRAGFGGTVTNAVAKLTKKGAKSLNRALGIRKGGFKGGKLGTISTSTVPLTVAVTSAESSTSEYIGDIINGNCVPSGTCFTYAGKITEDGITATASNGATSTGNPPVVTFTPQTGGSMSPQCTGGTLTGSQGTITLADSVTGNVITQSNPQDEFGNVDVTFDATATGLGSLGRATATNLVVTPGTCAADAATKTITVTAIQSVFPAAATLANQVFGLTGSPCGAGAPAVKQRCPLAGGDPIGETKYVIHTQ